jgi:hypothetical protein
MDQASPLAARVAAYFEMWNETDAAARRELVDEVWTADALSVDPIAEVSGRTAIDGHVAAVQQQYPGYRIVQNGDVDAHHDRARFPWVMRDGTGQAVLTGIDSVRLAADGRFAELVGYFDPTPA